MSLDDFYRKSPIVVQNIMTTAYGLKQRRLRYGGRYKQYVDDIKQAERWPAERLLSYQRDRLRRLGRFCYDQVPYYRSLFDSVGMGPDDLSDAQSLASLPLLEKEHLRRSPHDFVPREPPERLISQTTGGTTGTPLRYLVTPSAIQYNYATYEARFRGWAGVRFGDRMASFNGKPIVPAEAGAPPFWRYNIAFNQIYFSVYHLSEVNLPHYVRKLTSFGPRVIVGYVSAVHAVARFILAHGLEGVVAPAAVLVSSETLFDWIRTDIEKAFGCKVFNGYSLGELTAFISECEAGSLHVSPEYGVVEMEKIDGNLELVCTGLFNYGMPLIRYRTRDIVEPAEIDACRCGRELPTVKAVVGRVDDCVMTPEGNLVGPASLSLAFQSVRNLKEAQIHQQDKHQVTAYLSVTRGFDTADERFLLEQLRLRLGHRITIHLVKVPAIARTAAGKQRLVVSKRRGG